ncbi:MAG: FAD-dependent monooxygenase [Desulfuromonadales bacterium]|nr:FAD-dependent monooxygenase [Desulfuromonadales bacterium]
MIDAECIVVGAGPVGMLAALLCVQQGSSVLLLEQTAERHFQSRAIGITPPSLEILRSIGLAGQFIEQGVAVRVSKAFGDGMQLGIIDFSGLAGDFRFVLSLPQDRTEALLEGAVLKNPAIRFRRGHQVLECSEDGDRVIVSGTSADSGTFRFSGRYLLACDGGKSAIRDSLGIPFEGAPQRYTFLMGDYEDTTGWGPQARFFATGRGSVESFPLPDNQRRYVIRTPYFIKEYSGDYLGSELLKRAGVDVSGTGQLWESGFGVQSYVARDFCKGRVFLCGDAAHLMTPVGGQNMNIGFADAELAAWLTRLLIEDKAPYRLCAGLYNKARKRAVRAAYRRSRALMVLGTSGGSVWSFIRAVAAFIIMKTPLRQILVQTFSMQTIPFRNLDNFRKRYERELNL